MFATTGALAPLRSAPQRTANRGMSLATREQKAVVTNFAGAGRFLITFSRDEKVMIERHEENTSEGLRLRTVVEYNGERKRLFLIHPANFCR